MAYNSKISWADRLKCFFRHKWHQLNNDGRSLNDCICLRCGTGRPLNPKNELERLRAEKHLLQQLWVTVNLSCDPPEDCNDPEILKTYMRACMKKATAYEAFIDQMEV